MKYKVSVGWDGVSAPLVRVQGTDSYGPDGQRREASVSVDVNFDPSKPAPKLKPSAKFKPLPTQIDLPAALGDALRSALDGVLKACKDQLDSATRRAAVTCNYVAESRGEFDKESK